MLVAAPVRGIFCLGLVAIAAGLTAASPATAQGPAGSVKFAPHVAIYDLKLTSSRGKRLLEAARGRIVYDFSGSACEGYALQFRQVTELDNGEGKVSLKKGTAPKKVVLRFVGMRSLDTIKLSAGRMSGYISRGMSGGDGGLTLVSRAIKDGIEVEVAAKDGMKEWQFGWQSGDRLPKR